MDRKKAIKRAYRQRPSELGLMRIACMHCDRNWLDISASPQAYANGVLFRLKAGLHSNLGLAGCFQQHPGSIEIGPLEILQHDADTEAAVREMLEEEMRSRSSGKNEILVKSTRR